MVIKNPFEDIDWKADYTCNLKSKNEILLGRGIIKRVNASNKEYKPHQIFRL